MKRIISLFVVVMVMVAMIAVSAVPAFAGSNCNNGGVAGGLILGCAGNGANVGVSALNGPILNTG